MGRRPRSTSSEKQDVSTGPQAPASSAGASVTIAFGPGGLATSSWPKEGTVPVPPLGGSCPPCWAFPLGHDGGHLAWCSPSQGLWSPCSEARHASAGDSRRPALLPSSMYTPCQPSGTWSISPPCLGPATPGQCRANPKGMENTDAFIEYLLCARHQTRLLIAIIVFNPSTIWQGFSHFPGWRSKR